MKKSSKNASDIRPEYDFAKMKGGVRGKYAKRYRAGTNLVLLDPEVYKAFPTAAAVNEALRAVLAITKAIRRPTNRRKTG
jgi:alpha-beta hydrolase superfamily lysophospholipase